VTGLRPARQRTMAAVARRLATGTPEDWFTVRAGGVLIAGDHGPVNGGAPRAAGAGVLLDAAGPRG
jgi:hypothetical protein